MVRRDRVQAAKAVVPGVRRVLVVEDSRLQRRILASLLTKWGFEVLEAASAEEALRLCHQQAPDLVLSDWVMPGLSGPEFCRAFRALDLPDYAYFILLTSIRERGEVARGLLAGADDFLTKPVNGDELHARISAGARILAMQREMGAQARKLSETLAELQVVHRKIDDDLQQARKIQKALVPDFARGFGASRFSLLLEPCGHIGGDLVGLFSPGLNRVGFYSIDVSGHGITSALMTARLSGYLSDTHFDQNIAMEQRQFQFYGLKPPLEVARALNARLLAGAVGDEYFTMIYGTVDLYSGQVQMVQCGHPHPLVLRADGTAEFLGAGGMPIGMLPDLVCDVIDLQLHPGDRLLLYSDGLTEATDRNGHMLAGDGLVQLLHADKTPAESGGHGPDGADCLRDLYWRLCARADPNSGLGDDVSALLLDYRGI